ncbi:hypothetical protein HYH02_007088 [Chlamydomonas schloesseri]|uniref:Phytocyanin domain-containing protein n=1 Tax=Chlamydomonas schloesseri TaxID=2026947 RepID=A0A835WIK3_9CHLO|nr:hypothetical protein HYH02_007088 [Chlamydomonas schloesseri]|eukprot:KAG2448061.1 hypothetical protein HYH02_007088 [Chlamydomonas schloesseri]
MRASIAIVLALAAFVATNAAQYNVTWADDGNPLDLSVNCSDVVQFSWGPRHELEQSRGYGCGRPTIRNFGEGVGIVAPLVFANPGTYTFACNINDHCTSGKQLAKVHVGACATPKNTITWGYRRDNASYAAIELTCGETLTFTWASGRHDVAEVEKADCVSPTIAYFGNGTRFENGTYMPPAATGSVSITYNKAGKHHYKCDVPNHCSVGRMLLTVDVTCPHTASPPRRRSPPPRKWVQWP